MDAPHVDALRETLEQLRLEAAALRASRNGSSWRPTIDRRLIERDLHAGVQQHLVALSVNLQRAIAWWTPIPLR